jgi:Holliday junction resolvasome RuvABC endonuclease subunit
MRCLALDLSVHVGWVAFHRPDRLASHGTWHLPAAMRLGLRFWEFERWLLDLCRDVRPELLAFEEPIRGTPTRRAGTEQATNMGTQKLLQGLATVAELVAAKAGCSRCIEVATSSAKLKLAGHGRADKRAMIAAAIAMGIEITSEHEADALGVALCAYEHVGLDVKGYGGPLLATQPRWG